MKAVLPALTERGYAHLEIQEGGKANLEFLRVTFGDVSEDERQRVRRQLEEYSGLDTEECPSLLCPIPRNRPVAALSGSLRSKRPFALHRRIDFPGTDVV